MKIDTYEAFYRIYIENPCNFYAYNQYALLANELLYQTSLQRKIISYIKTHQFTAEKNCKIDRVMFKRDKENGAWGSCDFQNNNITFYDSCFQQSLSKQAFILLHEVTHSWQKNFDPLRYNPFLETEADASAASQMLCETCLKVVQHVASKNSSKEGYFSVSDFDPYIKKAQGSRCTAHSEDTSKLENALKNNAFPSEIVRLDNQFGTLFDRLPCRCCEHID